MRQECKSIGAAVTACVIALMAAGSSQVAAGGKSTRVSSVKASGTRLVVIAAGVSYIFEGKYDSGKGSWVEFEGGRAVAVQARNQRKEAVQKVAIERGAVSFETPSGVVVLEDGKYQGEGGGNPEPPEPQPEPQPPGPAPNAFEVRGGKVVAVWIGGSI